MNQTSGPPVVPTTPMVPSSEGSSTDQKALNANIQKAGAKVLIPHLIIKAAGLFTNYFIPNHYSLAIAEVFKVINDSVLNVAFLIGEQCLAPAYLPLFARAKAERGEDRAWRYTSILFNLQLIILIGIVAACVIFPEQIANMLTDWKGNDQEKLLRRDIFVKDAPVCRAGPSWNVAGELDVCRAEWLQGIFLCGVWRFNFEAMHRGRRFGGRDAEK